MCVCSYVARVCVQHTCSELPGPGPLELFHKPSQYLGQAVCVCAPGCLALPKLNLQFLTLHDYLLRNFNLFRLESTYEIRQDIEDVVSRMKPW